MKIQFKTAASLVLGLLFVLSACKKQSIPDEMSAAGPSRPAENFVDAQAANLVRTWLSHQQSSTDPLKTEKIHQLEEKLDFSGMRAKRLDADKQLLVVPIQPGLATLSENADVNVLLLRQDGTGNIRSGSIVQYSTNHPMQVKNAEAVFAMYDAKEEPVDASYRFLTITGNAFRKLTYQNGTIRTYSGLQKNLPSTGNKISQDPISPDQICTDWYWVTTTYYADGHTETTSRFAYRTCETTSGGGPQGEVDCGAVNDEIQGYSTSERQSQSILTQTSKSRTKIYIWTFYKQDWGMWSYLSYEEGVHSFYNGEWIWKSLVHKDISRVGWSIGGSLNMRITTSRASMGKYWAGMELFYSFEASAICKGSPLSSSTAGRSASPQWSVND